MNGKRAHTIPAYVPWPQGGKVVDGLRITIRTNSAVHKRTDTIRVKVRLENADKDDLIIIHGYAKSVYHPWTKGFMRLECRDARGRQVEYTPPTIAAMIGRAVAFTRLGGKRKVFSDVVATATSFTPNLVPGTYSLRVCAESLTPDEYDNPPELYGSRRLKEEDLPEGIQVLSKSTKSNTIAIRVVE